MTLLKEISVFWIEIAKLVFFSVHGILIILLKNCISIASRDFFTVLSLTNETREKSTPVAQYEIGQEFGNIIMINYRLDRAF